MIDPNLMARIRRRAYEMWEDEGRPEGRDRIHWLRAEAEFREGLRPAIPPEKLKPQKAPKPSSRTARADRAH